MTKWAGPTATIDKCEAPVRWKGGRLQQSWIITTVTAGDGSCGLVLDRRQEWRDVPCDDGVSANAKEESK